MILRNGMTMAALALAAFAAMPAKADVLQIEEDGAALWVSGGPVLPGEVQVVDAEGEIAVVPAEMLAFLPDTVIADPELHASAIPAAYSEHVRALAQRFDLSPALIEALVWQESRWRADAVSPVGARGLAQLMPGTARDLGVDPRDPFANLEGGARYLREQLDRFDGDLERALAAYNAGPGRVITAGGIPRIRETQHYVAAVMGRLAAHSRDDD